MGQAQFHCTAVTRNLEKEAQAHVLQVEKNLTAQAQEHVRQVESNLTHRAEDVIRQKVVQADAAINEVEMVVFKERKEKEAAILLAQQAKQRTLELENSATKGNEYVHALQQQGNAFEQAATQIIKELEEENKNIYERARQ